jgi:hypothetical protein
VDCSTWTDGSPSEKGNGTVPRVDISTAGMGV